MLELIKANKKVEEYDAQMTFDIKVIVEEADGRYTAYLRIGHDGTTNFLYSAPVDYMTKKDFVKTVGTMICVRTIVNYYWWLADDDDECEDE